MHWLEQRSEHTLSWLLEPGDPGVRYLTMRDLLDLPAADSALHEAQLLAHRKGPIAEV